MRHDLIKIHFKLAAVEFVFKDFRKPIGSVKFLEIRIIYSACRFLDFCILQNCFKAVLLMLSILGYPSLSSL